MVECHPVLSLFQGIIPTECRHGGNEPCAFLSDAREPVSVLQEKLPSLYRNRQNAESAGMSQFIGIFPRYRQKQQIFQCLMFGQTLQSVRSTRAFMRARWFSCSGRSLFWSMLFTSFWHSLYLFSILLYTVENILQSRNSASEDRMKSFTAGPQRKRCPPEPFCGKCYASVAAQHDV